MTEAVWVSVRTPEPRVWGRGRLADSLTTKAGPEERGRKLYTDPWPEPLSPGVGAFSVLPFHTAAYPSSCLLNATSLTSYSRPGTEEGHGVTH